MSTPRLSVVIPVRNCREWLPRALASAQAVPVAPLEIIVVDDGSTDGTSGFLAGAALLDPRIIVLRRDGGEGAAAARNAGIAVARAPVVGFLDADDAWRPERIAARVAWHEANPTATMSFAEYQTLWPDGRLEPRLLGYVPRFQAAVAGRAGTAPLGAPGTRALGAPGTRALGAQGAALVYGENPVCTSTVLAARRALVAERGFDPGLRQAEDWDLWIRLALAGPVGYSPAAETMHMHRPGSLSSEARARCLAVGQVAWRHRWALLRRSPLALACATARVAEARAELAEAEGRRLAQVASAALALLAWPSLRRARDAARAAAVAVGAMPGRLAVA